MAKTKGNPLQAALNAVPEQDQSGLAGMAGKPSTRRAKPAAASKKAAEEKRERPDREGTVLIGGHFPASIRQQLRIIAAEEDTTSQALIAEALNLLFVKKGKGKIV